MLIIFIYSNWVDLWSRRGGLVRKEVMAELGITADASGMLSRVLSVENTSFTTGSSVDALSISCLTE